MKDSGQTRRVKKWTTMIEINVHSKLISYAFNEFIRSSWKSIYSQKYLKIYLKFLQNHFSITVIIRAKSLFASLSRLRLFGT